MKNWKRIPSDTKFKRFYNTGTEFPKLSISLYPYNENESNSRFSGFKISCSIKESENEWWEVSIIPNELLNEVIDFLNEYENTLDFNDGKTIPA